MVAVECLSIDPIMRNWMRPNGLVAIGDVMKASVVGHMAASEHPGYAVGEYLSAGSGAGVRDSDGSGVTNSTHCSRHPPPT